MKSLRKEIFAGLMILVLAGCAPTPSVTPFTYRVDPTIKPNPETILGAGDVAIPLAAVKDDKGLTSTFIANQILITPKDQTELTAFLTKYGGTVIGNNAVPDPPTNSGIQMDAKFKQATQYVVQLDPSGVDLSSFKTDAQSLNASGESVISSENGARILALVAHESLAKITLSANFIFQQDALINASQERPSGGGNFDNAFTTSRFLNTGSKASVTQAWQFVAAHGIPRTMHIAVIDGGFWLDGAGHPFLDANGRSDLLSNPVQYDFNDSDYLAGGMNPNTCTGGSGCPWHGNGSAGTAAGKLNDQSGAAGTGGSVADPWLFKFNGSYSQQNRAVRTAQAWGADVISMSFGGSCGWWCRTFSSFSSGPLHDARDAGLVLVASAANNNQNSDDTDIYPCVQDSVICVGALAGNTNTRISYSNYGPSVDIWAPTDIPVMANGSSTPALANHNGTSASAPFIAGITAMMKAMNPALSSDGVRNLLRDTAWTDSSDANVSHYVNAFKAVMRAAGDQLGPDGLETNNTVGTARTIVLGNLNNLTIDKSGLAGWDYYRFSVPDYASADINLEYMPGLGNLNFVLSKEGSSGGAPAGVTNNFRNSGLSSDGRSYHANVLSPGTYRLLLSNANPSLYNMQLSLNLTGLLPDVFEANNTLASAANPTIGNGYEVNLHQNSDVDYYRFVVVNPLVSTFKFRIDDSDNPVNLHLFNAANTEINTSSSEFSLPNGSYTIQVEGIKGRYAFSTAYYFPPPPKFYPIREIFKWIDPGDPPIDSWLHGVDEVFAFDMNQRTNLVRLFGQGTHVAVLDDTGKVITDGVPQFDGTQQYGEQLALKGLQIGTRYYLRINRVSTDENPDQQTLNLPALSYNLGTYSQ
jgi:Subtilase family